MSEAYFDECQQSMMNDDQNPLILERKLELILFQQPTNEVENSVIVCYDSYIAGNTFKSI